eukprot:scaffold11292_cov67-Cyclotella_meneghiniana.AAC.3
MRALNGRESTLSNWLDNESEKFREMRVLAGPTLKTVGESGRNESPTNELAQKNSIMSPSNVISPLKFRSVAGPSKVRSNIIGNRWIVSGT